MTNLTRRGASSLLAFSFSSTVEWRCPRQNVLLEGPDASTAGALQLLRPHLPTPVVWRFRGAPLQIPSEVGALILEDVGGLDRGEQQALLTWIDNRPHTQIVSTMARSLFDLVTRGRFDPALYYRLNVVLLDLDQRHDFGFHAGIGTEPLSMPIHA